MPKQSTTKPPAVDYFKVPRRLWRILKKHLPAEPKPHPAGGRPRIGNRAVLNGLWYLLWTGAQWKAVKRDWFGVSSSVLHERFQTWQQQGVWEQIFRALVKVYRRERHIQWAWQAVDSCSCVAPLGGTATGKNPTDRGKLGAKIHLLVDQRGAPLAIVVRAPTSTTSGRLPAWCCTSPCTAPAPSSISWLTRATTTTTCTRPLSGPAIDSKHIKHRCRRGEPKPETCPIPGETQYPARRWVIERTFASLVKRRSVRTRWCKKATNWLAFVQLACASILCDMVVFG